ncbi:MAG: OmpA family protein [Paludibacteraceae bacterium]|nr:OmpA family protein [Paludibacteraceae bacterium]
MYKKNCFVLAALMLISTAMFAQEIEEPQIEEPQEVQVPTDSLGIHPWSGKENDNHIIIPEQAHWSMYLTAGFNITDADFTSEKKHGVWVPTVGLGAAYHWNNTWSLGMEYKFRNYKVTGSGSDRDASTMLKGMSHQANLYVAMDVFNMFRPQNKAKLFALDLILGGGALWWKNSVQYPNERSMDKILTDTPWKYETGTRQESEKMNKYKATGVFFGGVSAEFNLNRSFQLGLRGVYYYTTTDQVDARVRPENNDGFFDCEILLRYKFEPRQKSNVRNYMVDQQIANWNDGTYYDDPAMGKAKRDKYKIVPQKDTIWDITRDTVWMMPPTGTAVAAQPRHIRDYVVFFANDDPELDQMALSITGDAAMLLQSEPDYKAFIVGSCDNTGAVEYNKWLAVQRAKNVAQTLKDMGVDSSRVYLVGRGIMQDNREFGSFGPNRRVEIRIVTDAEMTQSKEEFAYFEQYKQVKKGSAVRQAGEGRYVSSSEALEAAKQKLKETGVIEQITDVFKSLKKEEGDAPEVKQKENLDEVQSGLKELIKNAVQQRPVKNQPNDSVSSLCFPNAWGDGDKPAEPVVRVEADTIVVAPNMTLGLLAKKYYGNASQWPKIFEANRDKLASPDQIQEGMTLIIPKQ